MIRRLLSFFVPINIHKQRSAVSKTLEITWANGQLVMDSRNTNYSFGSLQRVLRKGLRSIGFDRIRQMRHILVLGVAGGSVIRTLTDEIGYAGNITGVEIDPEVLALAKKYFNLAETPKLRLVTGDAFEFTLRTREKYDLVIIDVFQDTAMPNFLFESFFTQRLAQIVVSGGVVLFNTMTLNEADFVRNSEYKKHIDSNSFRISALPKLESHNELLVLQRV